MTATKIGTCWQVFDGADLVVLWLDKDGFHSQRVSDFNSANPIGHSPTIIPHEDLILAAEGQKKLL